MNEKNLSSLGASIFTNFVLNDYLTTFLRVDYLDINFASDTKNDSEIMFLGGNDFKLENNFSVIPGLAVSKFEKSGIKPDITTKLTLFWKF